MSITSLDPESVRKLVRSEFDIRQSSLLEEVKGSIETALKNNQKALVVSGGETTSKKSRKWEWAQILIPGLLTGAVGLGVWYTQTTLSDKINTATQEASTRYLLTQEYDKDKFKAYQRTMQRLTALDNAISGAKFGANGRTNAIKAKDRFDTEIDNSEFYFSPEIYKKLNDISESASIMEGINPSGSAKPATLRKQIFEVKQKIRDEVLAETASLHVTKP